MGKLTVSLNGVVERECLLDQEKTIIGRLPDTAIRIDDPAVSGQHAMIITIMEDSFLEDLSSTNGTYLNGVLVKKCALTDGDLIGVGNHILKYERDEADDDDDEFTKTMVIKPGMPAHQAASEQQAHAIEAVEQSERRSAIESSASLPPGFLQVLTGPAKGRELELAKALVTLGRPGDQVAVISRRKTGYYLTHIEDAGGGKKFPAVNGKEIGAQSHPLKNHDVIELAGVKIEFFLADG